MFCPQCGQRQAASEIRFCSGCGFPLAAVSEVVARGGQLPTYTPSGGMRQLSPRQKGIRKGAMLMLSTMLVVPLVAIISTFITGAPEIFAPIAAITCFIGGLLRIVYAVMFEEPAPSATPAPAQAFVPAAMPPNYLGTPDRVAALPTPHSAPAPAARAPRFDTGELAPPRPSVTDHTTRLLERQTEEPPQR